MVEKSWSDHRAADSSHIKQERMRVYATTKINIVCPGLRAACFKLTDPPPTDELKRIALKSEVNTQMDERTTALRLSAN